MRVKRKRVGRGGVAFNQVPRQYALFNGQTDTGGVLDYKIGAAYTPDFVNWKTYGGPVILPGTGWESNIVKDPSVLWDGTQYVCYYAGWNGTTWAGIGRATSQNPAGPWIKYASNPVLTPSGTSTDPDFTGLEFPTVALDGSTYRMWYQGYPNGFNSATNPVGTACYAESTDGGFTWAKHGTVIPQGSSGSFNEICCQPSAIYKSGSTWYVYFGGFRATDFFARSAYVTTTNPSSAASYSAPTQISNYTGTITIGGKTWQSNEPRGSVFANQSGTYTAFLTLWKPTDTSTILETCVQVSSPDLVSFGLPSGLMLPFDYWDTVSAENPSVIIPH